MIRVHYSAVMVAGMQSFKKNYESQVEYLRKAFTKEKNLNDFFIAVLLHFYDQNYQNSTKSRLSNKKLDMVPEVTLIQCSKMDIVTKFQVSIFIYCS